MSTTHAMEHATEDEEGAKEVHVKGCPGDIRNMFTVSVHCPNGCQNPQFEIRHIEGVCLNCGCKVSIGQKP